MKDNRGPDPLFDAVPGRRRVRSFVLREGRLTPGQERALESLWPVYGIANAASLLDFEALFGRRAPVTLEIGFGDGAALAAAALQQPEQDFIGIEVHRPGVGSLLQRLKADDIANVRILCADAVPALEQRIPDSSLAGLRLFFPDPWPKKRHHKRRIVQPPFVTQVRRKLAPGGVFHMATDWEDYAEHMLTVAEADPGLVNRAGPQHYAQRPDWRPRTRFEQRGRRLGHGVWDLMFERVGPAE